MFNVYSIAFLGRHVLSIGVRIAKWTHNVYTDWNLRFIYFHGNTIKQSACHGQSMLYACIWFDLIYHGKRRKRSIFPTVIDLVHLIRATLWHAIIVT